MTILAAGGGTMGPVTPLLTVLRAIRRLRPDANFVWAGTATGPERAVVEADDIVFTPIPVAKLPRYPSPAWLTWPFDYLHAQRCAEEAVTKMKPDLVVSVGGFTAVPVIRAARKRRIPCVIHQLDYEPGLANRSVAKICQSVTTSFRYPFEPFKSIHATRVPTPCRFAGRPMPSREEAAQAFGLDASRPIVFIVGGGTGAVALNEAVWSQLDTLLQSAQVIHATGRGKMEKGRWKQGAGSRKQETGYAMREFLDEEEMFLALAAADLVVSRAGMGSISELACLSKAAILVPITGSHQENNAAAMPYPMVEQKGDFAAHLASSVVALLRDEAARRRIGEQAHAILPTDDGATLAERWLGLIK